MSKFLWLVIVVCTSKKHKCYLIYVGRQEDFSVANPALKSDNESKSSSKLIQSNKPLVLVIVWIWSAIKDLSRVTVIITVFSLLLLCSSHGVGENTIRKGIVPRHRGQKVVIMQLTIIRTPLNQSDSSNLAPLTISTK